MERLRGMLSALQLVVEKNGKKIEIDSKQTKELAHDIARQVSTVSEKYEKTKATEDGERLLIKIYSETLRTVMKQSSWKRLFENIQEKT